jgi:4-hydroxybenzoate polyprenyltransferase
LIRATHAPPTAAVTAFVTATGAAAGLGARSVLLAAAILVGQMSIGWANDAIDAERDLVAGRRDKPVATGAVPAGIVALCAGVALCVDVPLSLALGWRPGAAHLAAVGSAWMYDARLKETLLSPLPYTVSFGLLPVIIATALPGHPLPQPSIAAAAACLGVAAHFANTVGDVTEDAMTGVRGLPQRIGPSASIVVAALLVVAAAGLLLAATSATPLTLAAVAAAAAGVVVLPVSLRPSASRHLAFLTVIGSVALLVIAFVVDGGNHLVSG